MATRVREALPGTSSVMPGMPPGLPPCEPGGDLPEFVFLEVRPVPEAAAESLTRAEHEVLDLLWLGLSDQEIAARRRRSLRTVGKQVGSIFAKHGVHSRAELLALLSRPQGAP
jgi:DNA-binding NarL/FixJ family response regulator